jgi:WD40 repeat protein
VAFSPDGKILATGGGNPGLFNVATLSYLGGPVPVPFQGADALAFSPDGHQLIYAQDGSIWRWDMRTHRVVVHAVIPGVGHPSAETFSPGGSDLVTVGDEVRLFSVASRRVIGVPFATGMGTIAEAVFSPDGRTLATASDNGVVLWDVATQRQIGTALNVNVGPVAAVAFSPDGMILTVADQDGTIRLWDIASHEQIGSPLAVNQNPVYSITFSSDGTVLAASSGGTRLWGMPPTRDLVHRVCAIAGGSISREQWNSYVKSEPFQPTCP